MKYQLIMKNFLFKSDAKYYEYKLLIYVLKTKIKKLIVKLDFHQL